MELEVWRRVGEGWRVGAAENKQNWRAGEGLGRGRGRGSGRGKPSFAQIAGREGQGQGQVITGEANAPAPALPVFCDLSELASNARDLPLALPWPCPPVPARCFCDLSELASNSQDSHLPAQAPPCPAPLPWAVFCGFERISV